MKQHITLENIEELSESQIQTLNNIWIPEKYDLASAVICTDVSSDKYDKIEFIVGGLEAYRTNVMLYDIRYIANNLEDIENEEANCDELSDAEEYEDSDCEEVSDTNEEFNYSYERPVSFNKKDCIPLLNIGQMIEILQRSNFGQGDFYLIASSNDSSCELGKNYTNIDTYVNEYEKKELCDVLWESIKAIL